jgi:hypothetical protein
MEKKEKIKEDKNSVGDCFSDKLVIFNFTK